MYIAARLHDKHGLSHGMCLYQSLMTLHVLNVVANDAESTQKIDNYVLIASLKSQTMGKLIIEYQVRVF